MGSAVAPPTTLLTSFHCGVDGLLKLIILLEIGPDRWLTSTTNKENVTDGHLNSLETLTSQMETFVRSKNFVSTRHPPFSH